LFFISIGFYIPDCEEKWMLKSIIEKHGGIVCKLHECHTYQIEPIYVSFQISSSQDEVPELEYFNGDRYRATWITDSVKAGYLLESKDYLVKKKESIDD